MTTPDHTPTPTTFVYDSAGRLYEADLVDGFRYRKLETELTAPRAAWAEREPQLYKAERQVEEWKAQAEEYRQAGLRGLDRETALDNRIAALETEIARLRAAAQAVVTRWEEPNWKDVGPTAEFIYRLRDELAAK